MLDSIIIHIYTINVKTYMWEIDILLLTHIFQKSHISLLLLKTLKA